MRKFIFPFFFIFLFLATALGNSIVQIKEDFGNNPFNRDLDTTNCVSWSNQPWTDYMDWNDYTINELVTFESNLMHCYLTGNASVENTTQFDDSALKWNMTNQANNPRYVSGGLLFIFEESIDISKYSNISYKFKGVEANGKSIVFWKEIGEAGYCISLQTGTTACPHPDTPTQADINNITWTCGEGSPCVRSFSLEQALDSNSQSSEHNLTDIKAVGFHYDLDTLSWSNDDWYILLDEINFTLLNKTNQLPTANITISDSRVCLNQSGMATIEVNISDNDEEGDTILYEIFDNYYNTTEYNTISYGTFDFNKDWSYLENTIIPEGYCAHNWAPFIEWSSRHNIVTDFTYSGWNIPDTNNFLSLNPNCDGDSTFLYNFENTLTYPDYFTRFKFPTENGVNISFTFYQANPANNATLRLQRTDENTTVYWNNTEIIELSSIPEHTQIRVVSQPESTNTFVHIDTVLPITINGTLQLIDTIGIKSDTEIKQEYFTYGSRYNKSIFQQSIKPNNITIYRQGFQSLRIRLTDTFHNGTNYNYYRLTFEVDECPDIGTGGLGTFDDNFNIFELFERVIAPDFQRTIEAIPDGQNKLSSLIWWVFVAIFLSIVISAYIASGRLPIVTGVIVGSSACWFISYLAGNTTNQISFLVLFALGIVVPLAKVFGGRHE